MTYQTFQIWKGLTSHYEPQGPPFSCVAAYQYWRLLNMEEWKLDEDPLMSSKHLLSNASVSASGKGERVRVINIEDSADYDCLAFSIPEILKEWADHINELVMDSACK